MILSDDEIVENFLLTKNVSRETFSDLKKFVDLIIKWNHSLNLFSKFDEEIIWRRHILDSLQLLDYITDSAVEIADIGSGGGFPALPLAITSSKKFTLYEVDKKKSAFLAEAIRVLHLRNADVQCCDVRTVENKKFSYLTSRALAPLDKLLSLIEKLITPQSLCIFPKGEGWKKEVDYSLKFWDFDMDIQPSITSEKSRILLLKNIRRREHGE